MPDTLGEHIGQNNLSLLIHQFLYTQLHPDHTGSPSNISISDCPPFRGRIYVFHSAMAIFYVPSNLLGVGGMYHKTIQSTPYW
jgi:hypothetical protein